MAKVTKADLSEITQDPLNLNKHAERGSALTRKSIERFGARLAGVLDRENRIIDGNDRQIAFGEADLNEIEIIEASPDKPVYLRFNDLDLADPANPARELQVALHRSAIESFSVDAENMLAAMAEGLDTSDWFRQDEIDELLAGLVAPEPVEDVAPQIDKADELRQKWGVELGQIWQLGKHRLICGDCTDKATVARLMDGEKATLCHADPPYGMGKEKDGIANDNLYRDKLDVFQMLWWKTARPHLEDNASAYIWGNAEDLWRLWYVGGLKDSERLTFRNQITWDKYVGNVKPTMIEMMRSYVVYREDCLFFMLGEQGFNNNADNYWDGWEPVRAALEADCKKMGWGPKDIERICGVGMYSHWFTKSQWTFIPAEHYKKLQQAAREHDAFKREHDAFKREHDELKRDFYATRAYFDNTHDNMTDVWQFGRVTGEDRHEHATPKPLEMVARAIKSSTPPDAIVYAPFSGTGPEIIACEQLSRQCRAIELDAGYVAITLQRFQDATGQTPVLIDS